jgi:predicted nuclease with TOPRIM domain
MDATAVVAVLLFCMMIGLFALAQQLEKTQTRLERVVVENARLTANFQAEQFQRLYDLVDDVNEKLDDEEFLTEQQLEKLHAKWLADWKV